MSYLDDEVKKFLDLLPLIEAVAKLPELSREEVNLVDVNEGKLEDLFRKRLRVLVLAYRVVRDLRRYRL